MPDKDLTRGRIRVELASDRGSSQSEDNGSKVLKYPIMIIKRSKP